MPMPAYFSPTAGIGICLEDPFPHDNLDLDLDLDLDLKDLDSSWTLGSVFNIFKTETALS